MKLRLTDFLGFVLLLMFAPKSWAGCSTSIEWMSCNVLQGIQHRPFLVCLPEGYENSAKQYPVLYLLHGGGCDYTQWEEFGHLSHVVDSLVEAKAIEPMIIVCPQANDNVMTWFDDPRRYFETYFFKELVPYIQTHYRTYIDKEHRAVAGFSMGGGGSVVYGIHHPEMFSTVYAISAYLRRQPLDFLKNDPLGEWRQQVVERNNPIKTVGASDENQQKQLKSMKWFIDCGSQDFTYQANQDFCHVLDQKGISYQYIPRDGAHNWEYWRPALARALINVFK